MLAVSVLNNCSGSSELPTSSVSTSLKCAPIPSDLTAEAKRKPVIAGETAVAVSAKLVSQVHRKNAALKRALAMYSACRAT